MVRINDNSKTIILSLLMKYDFTFYMERQPELGQHPLSCHMDGYDDSWS
jgi:hypothetical protein